MRVIWEPSAERDMRRLDPPLARQVRNQVERFALGGVGKNHRVILERAMVTRPSSIVWRNSSRTLRASSRSSPWSSGQLCARRLDLTGHRPSATTFTA